MCVCVVCLSYKEGIEMKIMLNMFLTINTFFVVISIDNSWMEPVLGTASFTLLCFQFSRYVTLIYK
jgi:hypothetical protein